MYSTVSGLVKLRNTEEMVSGLCQKLMTFRFDTGNEIDEKVASTDKNRVVGMLYGGHRSYSFGSQFIVRKQRHGSYTVIFLLFMSGI